MLTSIDVRIICEWDDTQYKVAVWPTTQRHLVFIEYEDGVCHTVTKKYLDSITIKRACPTCGSFELPCCRENPKI